LIEILVTGGAGFVGSALVRWLIDNSHLAINLDKLTYAGHPESLETVENHKNYHFEKGDICDGELVRSLFKHYKPDGVIHLAAESHVDRSIDGSAEFIRTNIIGTHNLLAQANRYYRSLDEDKKNHFRFLHVSTDEVYRSLGDDGYFTEDSLYDPHSPYSASKASADHLARAWHHTYGLPVLITNYSNNYGPYQFPEKLIPVVILIALQGESIPVYGKGKNVCDWLFVDDHVKALIKVLTKGIPGETYNIGGHCERTNIEMVHTICDTLDQLVPKENGTGYRKQITYVADRPGHDYRYAIDASKIKKELNWMPEESIESGIEKTIKWYLNNMTWVEAVTKNNYNLGRLGVTE